MHACFIALIFTFLGLGPIGSDGICSAGLCGNSLGPRVLGIAFLFLGRVAVRGTRGDQNARIASGFCEQ